MLPYITLLIPRIPEHKERDDPYQIIDNTMTSYYSEKTWAWWRPQSDFYAYFPWHIY